MDMKLWRRLYTNLLVALCLGLACHAQQAAPANANTDDEASVYAAILDQYPSLGPSSKPMLANRTATFACNDTSCNGFLLGSCSGLRKEDETEAKRMSIVKRDIPALDDSTIHDFVAINQQCASLPSKLPTKIQYHFIHDDLVPASWPYTALVYFSRVAFNSAHTSALVYLGLVSQDKEEDSKGTYILLNKFSDTWTIANSSAVWKLAAQ